MTMEGLFGPITQLRPIFGVTGFPEVCGDTSIKYNLDPMRGNPPVAAETIESRLVSAPPVALRTLTIIDGSTSIPTRRSCFQSKTWIRVKITDPDSHIRSSLPTAKKARNKPAKLVQVYKDHGLEFRIERDAEDPSCG